MTDLRIRDYRTADRDEVAALWHDAWLASGLATAKDPTPDRYRRRLDGEGSEWLIRLACFDRTIVGFVALQCDQNWLRQLFVAPRFQRAGIGGRLLDEARRRMPDGFRLNTDIDNRAARSFYKASGLRARGEGPHPRWGHAVAFYTWP